MKKALHILLVTLGILVVLVVAAVILAFQPGIQTWAARKAVSGMKDMEITIGHVDAGLSKIELSGIRVKQAGMVADLPSATVETSLFGLLKSKVDIKKLVAKDWTVDLSQSQPAQISQNAAKPAADATAAKKSASESFSGIFNLLKLPVDLTIAEADVEGTVILPPQESGAQPARAKVALKGGQLAPGSDAKFDITGDVSIPAANSPVSSLKVQSTLTARMETPRTFQSIGFSADASATGVQFPQGARLRAQMLAASAAAGENYAITLKTFDAASEKNLLSVQAVNPTGPQGFDATWTLDMHDTDVAPFILGLGLKLPAFTAKGMGTLTADDSFKTIHAAGKFTGDVSKLETFKTELAALGSVNFSAAFDLVNEGDFVRISTLTADIAAGAAGAGKIPVASIKTLQLIEYNTATGTIKVPDLNADLVHVDMIGVPLAWAEPFIQGTGFEISGGALRGSLSGKARDGGFSLRTNSPIALSSLTIAQQQPNQPPQQLVQNVNLSLNFAADYVPSGWSASVSDLSIQSGADTLLTLNAKAASPAAVAGKPAPAISATGTFRANIPALLAQPAAAGFRLLANGTVDGDFTAKSSADLQQVALKLTASNLQASDKTALPKITADLRADLHGNGQMEVQAPLTFELNSRKSDIELTANIKPEGARQNIDATLQSDVIYVEDLKTFAALAPASPASATPAAAAATAGKPDTKAPWDSVTGQVKLGLKKVVYTQDVQAGNITGTLKITPSLLSLDNLQAVMGDGGEAKVSGTVKFDAASAAQPYDTSAKVAVTNFDPAPILLAVNPGKKPTVEGKFDITGAVSGKSATLPALADSAAADLTLNSRGGKFNGFATPALESSLGAIQKLASSPAASSVVGGLLSMVGGKTAGVASVSLDKIKAGAAMLNRFIAINFDQMNIDASYSPGKQTVIKNFSILSPNMRLTSNGTLGNDGKLSWAKQAIKLVAAMSVRGDQAADMRTLGLLKDDADAMGFTPLLNEFPIEGTASSLASDALVKQLTSSVPGLSTLLGK